MLAIVLVIVVCVLSLFGNTFADGVERSESSSKMTGLLLAVMEYIPDGEKVRILIEAPGVDDSEMEEILYRDFPKPQAMYYQVEF